MPGNSTNLADKTTETSTQIQAGTGWIASWQATAVAILVFLLALTKFAYQDVARLKLPLNDFTSPWLLSKAFVEGANPYSFGDVSRIWDIERARSGPMRDFEAIFRFYGMIYPPTALPIIAPIAMLHWRAAIFAYLALSTVFLVAMILLLAQRLPSDGNRTRMLCFAAFALALAPIHSGIHESNPSTLTIAFLLLAVVWMGERPYGSGVALALALCLKPQVAFLFFGYPWLRKKWKTALTGLGVYASIFGGSVLWMRVHGVHWIGSYMDDARQWSKLPTAHFEADGLNTFQQLNLQVLVFQFTHNLKWSDLIAWSIFLVLAAASAYLIWSRVSDEKEATGLALVSVLTLLPVYQRFYTGAILVLVLYWAMENWPNRRAVAAFLLTLPLLLPLAAMIQRSAAAKRLEAGTMRGEFVWNLFLLPHVIWIELVLIVLLLGWAMKLPAVGVRSATDETV